MSLSIVFQGPTKYYKNIINCLPSEDVELIWSSWNDEPKENIEEISKTKIKLVLNDKPKDCGIGNLNYQTYSTINGIKNSKNNYILKMRSDILVNNYDLFIEKLFKKKDKLTFLCWHDHRGGYPVDYFCFGNKKEVLNYWNVMDYKNQYFAEYVLFYNYCINNNITMDKEVLKNNFNYILRDLNNDVIITWLKYNKIINDYSLHEPYRTN